MTRFTEDGVEYVVLRGNAKWLDPDKPYAIKYNGLADGKGVILTNNKNEFVEAIHEIERRFFGSGKREVQEKGQEAEKA